MGGSPHELQDIARQAGSYGSFLVMFLLLVDVVGLAT
jgi:hypothetical protein